MARGEHRAEARDERDEWNGRNERSEREYLRPVPDADRGHGARQSERQLRQLEDERRRAIDEARDEMRRDRRGWLRWGGRSRAAEQRYRRDHRILNDLDDHLAEIADEEESLLDSDR